MTSETFLQEFPFYKTGLLINWARSKKNITSEN